MGRGKRERRRAAEHGASAVTTPPPTSGPRAHRRECCSSSARSARCWLWADRPEVETLERVLIGHPYDRDTLSALIAYTREQGSPRRALPYARRLAELDPTNPELRQLVRRLEAGASR